MLKSNKRLNKSLRGQGGITLLALIVTIIVLLILSGISIAMLVGENGIYNNAKTAKILTDQRAKIEKINLAIASARITGLGKVDETELKKELTNYFGIEGNDYKIAGNQQDGYWLIVTDDNIKDDDAYFINASGELEQVDIEEAEEGLIVAENKANSYAIALVDDLGTRSTIYLYGNPNKEASSEITTANSESPVGSTVTNTDAIIDTPSYEATLSDEANYVAYTVNRNGTYKFNITVDGDTTETTVIVKNIEKFTSIEALASEQSLSYAGGKTNAYTYKGAAVPKGYFVDTKSNVDTGLVVTDSIDPEGYSTGNEWVWVPVNSTVGNADYYVEDSGIMWGTDDRVSYSKYGKLWSFNTNSSTGITTRSELSSPQVSPSGSTGYTEPFGGDRGDIYSRAINRNTGEDFGTKDETGAYTHVIGMVGDDQVGFASQCVNDFNNMVTSVDTYGGFFISRYELIGSGKQADLQQPENQDAYWADYYNRCLSYRKSVYRKWHDVGKPLGCDPRLVYVQWIRCRGDKQ